MEVAAVEGSYASVIGGAPAAAVVFAGEVNKRTAADPRVTDLEARIAKAAAAGAEGEAARLAAELAAIRPGVRSDKLGEVAAEFDAAHSVERAHRMGSVHRIVPSAELRPYLVDAVRRGMRPSAPAGSTVSSQAPLATRTRATARSFAAGSRRPSARAFSSPSSSDPTAAASWAPDDHSAWSAPAVEGLQHRFGQA